MKKIFKDYFNWKIPIIFLILLVLLVTIFKNKDYQAINVFANTKKLPIYNVDRDDKKIAISFDAAYGDEYTLDILETLDKYDIKTTFFLVKFWIDKFPHQVKEIYKRGHEIGNHSASHPNMSQLSREQMAKELNDTGDLIYELTGERPILFRPPYGDYSDAVIEVAQENNYYTIQWDIDSLDWKELGVEPVVDRVVRNVDSGSIVLFHNNAEYVSEYLPLVLEGLVDKGFEIVPISQLIYKDNYKINNNGTQIPEK